MTTTTTPDEKVLADVKIPWTPGLDDLSVVWTLLAFPLGGPDIAAIADYLMGDQP